MNLTLQTERLLLRPFSAEDAPALNRISNQKYVLDWMPDWESTIEDTERLIRWFISQAAQATKTTARIMFAVELQGELIGMVGIGNKEEVDNEIEIAYFVSQVHAGKGYITEAVKAVSAWALNQLGLDFLMAIVETDNPASQRVVEKVGFQKLDTRMILNSGETQPKPFFYYRLFA